MKNRLTLLLLAVTTAWLPGCQSNDDLPISPDPQMIKLATPIVVNLDSTIVVLSDYFFRPAEIDSVVADPSLSIRISSDTTQMTIIPNNRNFPKLSSMTVWSGGYPYSLLLEKTTKVWYRFTFDPQGKKYKKVQLKGQMNEWNPAAGNLVEKEEKWVMDFNLFPGKYQYKLILDGKEVSDPRNADSISNGLGSFNSILTIGTLSSPQLPALFTLKAEGDKMMIGLKNKADSIFVLWQNHLLDSKFWNRDSAGISIRIPRKARSFDRSFIRVYAYNNVGLSNQVLVPLQEGEILMDPEQLTRNDHEAMILYFLMVDRFKNGNKENDKPIADPEIHPKVNYMGGDLAGIKKAIEDGYFSDLGVNSIWISPITQNPLVGYKEYPAPHRKFSGYHGYWPITLTTVDTRFGTSDELRQMVGKAHGNNMNMIIDYVSHHAHEDYPVFKQHPDWTTPLDLPGGRKNLRIWDEHRLTTWFDTFLPTFDLTKPEVAEMVSDSALFWIKEYKIDGFRHDAAKHVPENYWRMLTKKLNEQVSVPDKRPVYQIGETFGSRDLVASYINPGMLDAQFEFNLFWDVQNSFALDYTSFRDLNYSLQQTFAYFGEHNLMGNITGNQDMSRFISYASGALSFSENDAEAGWNRDIQVKDTVGYHKLASMHAFNMTIPGIPVIYYGDEFGMPGADDPDNRRMMKFDSLNPHEQALKATTSKLAKFRGSNLALIYGDFKTLKVSEKTFVYMRSYFNKVVVVIFNKDKSAKKIDFELPDRYADYQLKSLFGKAFTAEKQKITIDLSGNSFEILAN